MKKNFYCKKHNSFLLTSFLIFLFAPACILAQPVELGPSIGLESMPVNSDEVCDIPFYPLITDSLEGMTEGDLIPDFTLYTSDGEAVHAAELLSDGKPALFISGSYTCWVFRDHLSVVNNLQSLYGDNIHIYIIYTVEAHPIDDISPYFGVELTGDPNYTAGILYNQPDTYGERKEIVNDMLADLEITVPVLIDGPCNEWWLNFGTNPNCAWLVQSDGIIYDAETWLDRFPEDIFSAVEGLFGISSDGEPVPNGLITAEAETDCVSGNSGETIIISGSVTNEDTADAYLDVVRIDEVLPDDWQTSICTDICFPPDVSDATMYVNAGETLPMHVYFYTNGPDASGTATILIKNHYIPANNFTYVFKACTGNTAAADVSVVRPELYLNPNPATDEVQLQTFSADAALRMISIYEATGKIVFTQCPGIIQGQWNVQLQLQYFNKGIYAVKMLNGNTVITSQLIIQ